MIEVAHRQHESPSFRSTSTLPSSSRSAADLAPLPVRHLKAPPSPLVNNFTSSSFTDEEAGQGVTRLRQEVENAPRTAKLLIHNSSNGKAITHKSVKMDEKVSSPTSPNSEKQQQQQQLIHRIRKGQKWEDFQPPLLNELPSLQSIDSPFQMQEYLSLLIRLDPHNVQRIVSLPHPSLESSRMFAETSTEKGKARDDESAPFGSMDEESQPVDTDVWIYEQLRRLVLDFSTPWLTTLQKDCDKKKNPKTCEAMNADDWMYLCASHGEEKQCCAIDYIIHTLDGTAALLNSQRHFPSRTFIPTTSLRHFGSITRRLSRVFVHAFEHHRDVFEACEAETSLYARFIALVQTYDLISVDSLPRLGGAIKEETKVEVPSASVKDLQDNHVTRLDADESARDIEPSRGIEKRLLFESDVASPQDEDEDEEEEVEEEEKPLQSGPSSVDRSDTNSSKITAVHVSPEQETTEAFQEVKLELPRKKPDQEAVPQDVKDDEDEEQ